VSAGPGPGAGAVVTGGGRGLGRGIAHLLAARGLTVHVTDVDGDAARAVAAELGGAATGSALDVRDEEACRAVAAATVTHAGSLAVWVNNAGVLELGPAWEQDAAARRRQLEVNTLGVVGGTLAALEHMRPAGRGHVVTVVSLAGLVAVTGEAVYSASKHAALAFSLGTLADLRVAGEHGVDISCVCPDGIWTPMLHETLDDPAAALSYSGVLLEVDDVVAAVGRVLDRPRPVLTVPRWRGAQVRLFDALPGLAVRLTPLVLADARRRQRRHARRLRG
jgi:NAD(P)-dependent dehydrogenase (short-subunit alcohol dehydrogenase family)